MLSTPSRFRSRSRAQARALSVSESEAAKARARLGRLLAWITLTTGLVLAIFASVARAETTVAASSTTGAPYWPQFRGPQQNGVGEAKDVPLKWSETENVTWKTELPGRGWSSPVVGDGFVWMTTAVEVKPTEEELEALMQKSNVETKHYKVRQVAKSIELRAIAVELETGELMANVLLDTVVGPDAIHAVNSYASPTPYLEEGILYCEFGTFGVHALDADSLRVLWSRKFPIIHNVGPGSSPLLVGNLLILVRDGVDEQFVVALNKADGETVWRKERPPMDAPDGDRMKSYSTPLLIEHEGKEQLVIPTSQWVVSYEPATGEEIWRVHHGTGFSLVPRPVYGNGLVYACTGFGKPELWAIKPDGKGDVTETHVAWKESKRISKKPSPLLVGEQVYALDDGGVLSCMNAITGEVLWAERVGGNYSASPLFVDEKLYFSNEEGATTVLAPGPEFQVLAENQLEGKIMASLVPLDGGLLIRSDTALYRIGQ